MNAHSKVDGVERNAQRRLRSRAFRDGLHEGFAAPALFFLPMKFTRTMSVDASVHGAWKAVARALKTAERTEVKSIGQTTGKTRSRKR